MTLGGPYIVKNVFDQGTLASSMPMDARCFTSEIKGLILIFYLRAERQSEASHTTQIYSACIQPLVGGGQANIIIERKSGTNEQILKLPPNVGDNYQAPGDE